MPWDIVTRNGQHCVRQKAKDQVLHCYDNEEEAKKYLGALYANVHEKEVVAAIEYLMSHDDSSSAVRVKALPDGNYWITAVSTAALKDREGETFGVPCIDYDLKEATTKGDYPEFTVFHKRGLGIGKVQKMTRAGIFAVDEGVSYKDPFSLGVCEKMLANNDGVWRVSRGFRVYEVSGDCPNCNSILLIETKHMLAGYRCPTCKSVYLGYKGVLGNVHFRKARTFDVTVTDNPAVPWTGVSASKISVEEPVMNKEMLKKKLLDAGLEEKAIDERLATLNEDRLKEFDDIPEAEVLKEFTEEKEDPTDGEQLFVLDPEVLKDFTDIVEKTVEKKVAEALDGLTIDLEDLDISMKEVPGLVELKEVLERVEEKIDKLLGTDETRIKELIKTDVPRAGKLRILRHKAMDDDEEGEEEEEGSEPPVKTKKPAVEEKSLGVVLGGDGTVASSMTDFMLGKK